MNLALSKLSVPRRGRHPNGSSVWRGLLLVVVPLGYLLYYGFEFSASRPVVSPSKLLISMPAFPDDLTSGTTSVDPVNWRPSGAGPLEGPSVDGCQGPGAAGQVWSNNGTFDTSPQIAYLIASCRSPLRALLAYRRVQPPDRIAGVRVAAPSLETASRVPVTLTYRSPFTDQQSAVCAFGTPERCQVWYAWLRYGQYVLKVRLVALEERSDAILFSRVVEAIDTDIGRQMGK